MIHTKIEVDRYFIFKANNNSKQTSIYFYFIRSSICYTDPFYRYLSNIWLMGVWVDIWNKPFSLILVRVWCPKNYLIWYFTLQWTNNGSTQYTSSLLVPMVCLQLFWLIWVAWDHRKHFSKIEGHIRKVHTRSNSGMELAK